MSTGATLYLVSACGSADEFVAAFRRYADRTGLFIPSTAPLPAGRKGRLALTLKDGGVMIEGEAEILQSSTKATVLHGRPGMTIKFVAPDEPSKTVIAELEKARLAMKPQPPSVAPRPALLPAEPRPVPPPVGGRVDAANALAECVVIGDPSVLVDTGSTPRIVSDAGSGKAAFSGIPDIPRSRTPSTPPELRAKTPTTPPELRPRTPTNPPIPARPRTPSTPPELRARTPSTPPPDGGSGPIRPIPHKLTHVSKPHKATSIGFPVVTKPPAAAVVVDEESTAVGDAPPGPATDVMDVMDIPAGDDTTAVGHVPAPARPIPFTPKKPEPVAPTTPKKTDPMAAAAPPKKTETMPTAMPASSPLARPAAADSSGRAARAAGSGIPVSRQPILQTQPVGIVPAPGEPSPPVMPKTSTPAPRGKNATRPPLTPRHPTPVAPIPIVRSPAKAAPVVEEEEQTDLAEVPLPSASPSDAATAPPPKVDAIALAETVDRASAYPADAATDNAPADRPQRSGGMRASEIMAAIPTDDWTMTPDAPAPTVLSNPTAEQPAAATDPGEAPKRAPTGDWSIQLDPEAGWSEPAKVEKIAAVAAAAAPSPEPEKKKKKGKRPDQPSSGNPTIAVASSKALEVQQWEDKPTHVGEKIEIDSTLMEPLTPLVLDDDILERPLPAPGASGTGPQAALRGAPPLVAPPSTQMPVAPTASVPPPSPFAATALAPSPFPAPPMVTAGAQASMFGFPGGGAVAQPTRKNRRALLIGIGAVVALAAGFGLVLALSGDKQRTSSPATQTNAAPTTPTGSGGATPAANAAGSGSATAAVVPAGSGSGEPGPAAPDTPESANTPETPEIPAAPDDTATAPVDTATSPAPTTGDGPCTVSVTSIPAGAEIYVGDDKLGATPGDVTLPCGTATKLSLRKARYATTSRSITPVAGAPTKVSFKLARPVFTVKVTSTPPGATILAGGRPMGVTPGMIKLPANEPATIVVSKPGFRAASATVTPKANNTAHHVKLEKKTKR